MADEDKAVWSLFREIQNKKITIDQFIAEFDKILTDEFTNKLQTLHSVDGKTKNNIFHEVLFFSFDEASKAVEKMLKPFQSLGEEEFVAILKQKNKEGYTVLHLAVKRKQTSVIKLLLETIAEDETKLELINQDLSEMEDDAPTILHLAEQQGCYGLVNSVFRGFTEWRFAPIVQSIRNETHKALYEVLQMSVESENVKRFETLLNLIPDYLRLPFLRRQSKSYGCSVLHIAFENGDADVLKAIKNALDFDSDNVMHLLKEENSYSDTPVQLAIRYGHSSMISLLKELLVPPEDICKVLRAGTTPALHFSASVGHDWFEKVFALVPETERENMLRQPTQERRNVVHWIFHYGNVKALEAIESVLKDDSDFLEEMLMSTDADGSTPLHLAAQEKQYEIIQHITESPKISDKKLFELFVKINKREQSVVSIALDEFFGSKTLGKILKPVASHMEEVKLRYESCKEKNETAKENCTKVEKEYYKKKKKVQESELAKTKTVEMEKAALHECQKMLEGRYKDLSKTKKELDGSEIMREVITKNLQLVKLVIQKGCEKLSSLVVGLLELMYSPIESLGLLILLAESGNADFTNTHHEIVRRTLEKIFEDQDIVREALECLEMRAKPDISDADIKKWDQKLLHLATSNMADQKADQYVLRWTDSSGNTLAHIAALAGDSESIKRLIEWQITSHPSKKASVLHSVNNAGQTPGTVPGITQTPPNWESELLKDLDKYPTLETGPDGLKFLIFYQSEDRPGAEEEADMMRAFGRAFGVEPEVFANLTCEEVRRAIKPEGENIQPTSCLIVAILAHGASGRVEMSDGLMEIKDISIRMRSRQGNDRPMVLLLQACQRELPEQPEQPAQPPPEIQPGDEAQEHMPNGETVENYLKGTQRQQESDLSERLSRHKVPRNIKLDRVPPLGMVQSSNLVLRSTFAMGKMVTGLREDPVGRVAEMTNHGTDAISMLSQAYCFLKGRQVRTRTEDGFPEEYDLPSTSRNAFDRVPPHFLCLSATVNSGAVIRGLMTRLLCQELNRMIAQQQTSDDGPPELQPVEIDIQRLFAHVRTAVYEISEHSQVPIIAGTPMKRLCLRAVRPVP